MTPRATIRTGATSASRTEQVAAAATRLLGTRCTVTQVLSERRLPSAGTVLVVALDTEGGTTVVARSGPPTLVSAGVRSQSAAAAAVAAGEADGVLRVPRVLRAEPGLAISEHAPGSR